MRTIKLLCGGLVAFCLTVSSCATPNPPQETLKSALDGKFLIGTALNKEEITGRDTEDIRIVTEQFNSIVAENCMKSEEIHPEEHLYNFDLSDAFVNFGTSHNMAVIGHTLIWHSQCPKWFCHDENGELVSPEILKERMKEHIYTIVGRYKGRIMGWDVVNEAILEDGTWRKSPFYQILGEEFMYLAFQYAHEADPDAELYYNDYNEWHPGKRDAIVKMTRTMKERGLRIDGIGMQAHVGMSYPAFEEYQAAIDAYASTGVKVMVTEFDISALPSPWESTANVADTQEYNKEMNPYTEGLPEEISEAWNARMLGFFELFLKNSDKISRVTMWGVSDGSSWKNNFPMRGRTDYPLLFDRNYQAKPAVEMIIRTATHKE